MNAFSDGDGKNRDWVEGNNEWTEERCGEKSKEWAEREAVNQRRESEWREREVRSVRWRKRGRRAGQQQWRWRIKMCGEVMAVMNSPWLISRSQVGVWRLDFNIALWLHSACKIITGKKSKLGIISYNANWLCQFALDGENLHNLPCLGCSGLCYSGSWVNNSK